MEKFEDLQALWQTQPQPAVSSEDLDRLTRSLRNYGRRTDWIFAVKLAIVVFSLSWAPWNVHGSPLAVAGILMIGLLGGTLMIVEWRSRRALRALNFTDPSLAFVRNAIAELYKQREPFRQYYWPVLLTFAAGENLIFAFGLHAQGFWQRFGSHLFATAVPFAAYEVGRRIRARRFERDGRPVLDQLRAIERSVAQASGPVHPDLPPNAERTE